MVGGFLRGVRDSDANSQVLKLRELARNPYDLSAKDAVNGNFMPGISGAS